MRWTGARRRIGLARQAGAIDFDAPYKRIAAEEAWTFPEIVKAQTDYLASGDAGDNPALDMTGMFAAQPELQAMLQDISERVWSSGGPSRPRPSPRGSPQAGASPTPAGHLLAPRQLRLGRGLRLERAGLDRSVGLVGRHQKPARRLPLLDQLEGARRGRFVE